MISSVASIPTTCESGGRLSRAADDPRATSPNASWRFYCSADHDCGYLCWIASSLLVAVSFGAVRKSTSGASTQQLACIASADGQIVNQTSTSFNCATTADAGIIAAGAGTHTWVAVDKSSGCEIPLAHGGLKTAIRDLAGRYPEIEPIWTRNIRYTLTYREQLQDECIRWEGRCDWIFHRREAEVIVHSIPRRLCSIAVGT